MSESSNQRSADFLKISDQFKLGILTTEASHPVTANLSRTAAANAADALRLLFEVDADVVNKYREFVHSGRARQIQQTVVDALLRGGKVFFTGCGSTGRLSIQLVSIWRDFWQQQRRRGLPGIPTPEDLEHRAFSVMAGGDFALIKSVEGFEDFTAFGARQLADLGVSASDVVFAITEGGETSFVIGTAWQGLEAGAKVYFVYNNPDPLLCQYVERSRAVIQEPRIEKINLTTGPMAITGSTRMQATSIQLCVLLTMMEMVFRELLGRLEPGGPMALPPQTVPEEFLEALQTAHQELLTPESLSALSQLVLFEESIYRTGHKITYFADHFGIDVLTDTTERSPTYCTPPFRKFDDATATESWAFLFVPKPDSAGAWKHILKRRPNCIEWQPEIVRPLVGQEKVERTVETLSKIRPSELMRFRIGLDGLPSRILRRGDGATCIVSAEEMGSFTPVDRFYRHQLQTAIQAGARIGLLGFGTAQALESSAQLWGNFPDNSVVARVPVPPSRLLLDGTTRVIVKLVLNAVSTCTMVRLGRVMGNYMIWVVPSNLKLIDRATRYIQKLTGVEYAHANRILFEVIEYIEPRMKTDRAYPPAVGLSVRRIQKRLSNEEAELELETAR